MLFVGDIHINSRFKDRILTELKRKILSTYEDNIIFLGDYVYHFSYDRRSLVELFNFFLDLAVNYNKKIFILSGNHDWINDVFVFEEIKNLIEVIKVFNKIRFITEPLFEEIEGEKVLFLPYNFKLDWGFVFNKFNLNLEINDEFNNLLNSLNEKEKYSGYLNRFLDQFISKYGDDILVIHHFYTTDFSFVGQRGKFKFKDIALFGNKFLSLRKTKLVSGHLHQSFAYKNYLCCGSVWATNHLESGQFKFIFQYNKGNIKPILLDTNFYLPISYKDEKIDKNYLLKEIKSLFLEIKKYFDSDLFNVDWNEVNFQDINLKNVVLQIISEELDYDDLKNVIDDDLFKTLEDIKIKRKTNISNKVVNLMLEEKEKLTTSFKGWKDLLKIYLKQKYGENAEKYLDVLRSMDIL